MVSYFNAGTQWATAPGNPKKVDPDEACGLKVAVQKGTVQEEEDLPAKVKECQAAGKPLDDAAVYTGQDQATAAVATGKADAMLADSPVVAYAVKQSEAASSRQPASIYDAAPYGYVVPRTRRTSPRPSPTPSRPMTPPAPTRRSWPTGASRPAPSPTSPSTRNEPAHEETEARATEERPGRIDAVPVRHPRRWVAIAVIALLVADVRQHAAHQRAFNWPFICQAMQQSPVLRGPLQGHPAGDRRWPWSSASAAESSSR